MTTEAKAFNDASATVLPWGPYRGRTIGQTGSDPAGLQWLVGAAKEKWCKPTIREALLTFLGDSVIRRRKERMGIV